ncbi:hypothetical protein P5E51_16175, partial [Clostridium perfringens]|nr:hypothetical protein [Clostridium perfringens]
LNLLLPLVPGEGGTILLEGGVRATFDEEMGTEDLVDLGVPAESRLSNPKLGCLLALLDVGRGLGFSSELDLIGVSR